MEEILKKLLIILEGVVYEDPWLAGGHNGLSNNEDPLSPQPPYPRVKDLRLLMNQFNLEQNPYYYGRWSMESF